MPDKKTGWLGYNSQNDRIGILNNFDLFIDDELHCGTSLEVFINGKWVADRLEMKWENKWYLVESKLEGNQLEGLKVRY